MLTFTQNDNIGNLIEQNLIDLYHITNLQRLNDLLEKQYYSAIYTKNSIWPNFIFNLNVDEKVCRSVFLEMNSEIEKNSIPPFIITGPKSELNSFEEIFNEFGIRKIMEWPAMAIGLNNFSFTESDKISIKEVDNLTELNHWLNIVSEELYNNAKLSKEVFLCLLKNDKVKLYLGYQNNEPTSTALLFLSEDIAGIYMIATSKNYRKKGFGSYITRYVINEAKNKKYLVVVLQATPDGYQMYKNIGFQEFGMFNIYWKVGKTLK